MSLRSLKSKSPRLGVSLSRTRPSVSLPPLLNSICQKNASTHSSYLSLRLRPATYLNRPFAQHISPYANAWRKFLSTETRSAIDKAVGSAPVVLFMKGTPETPQCGFSRASIQILGLQGVDPGKFTAFNVLEDEELRQGIKEYSDWPTIPQLYVDKEFVGGCDILVSMHQDGSLAKLLEEKSVVVPAEEEKPKQS